MLFLCCSSKLNVSIRCSYCFRCLQCLLPHFRIKLFCHSPLLALIWLNALCLWSLSFSVRVHCYKMWYKGNSMKSLMLHDQKGDLLTCTLLTYRHCWVAAATTGKPLSVLGRRHRKLSIGHIGNEGMSRLHLQRLELPQKMLILPVFLKSLKWLLLTLHCTRRILLEPCDSILGWRPPMLPGTRVRLTNFTMCIYTSVLWSWPVMMGM